MTLVCHGVFTNGHGIGVPWRFEKQKQRKNGFDLGVAGCLVGACLCTGGRVIRCPRVEVCRPSRLRTGL